MFIATISLQLLCAAAVVDWNPSPQSVTRDSESIGVPVALGSGGFVYGTGDPNRNCDHATVAMNKNRDVVVAYQGFRYPAPGDLPDPGPTTYKGQLKQVEVAYYEFRPTPSGEDAWVHLETRVIGSVEHAPLSGLDQQLLRCERPDVVAVDDKFFVVWTRRYQSANVFPNQDTEPAVLECAWIEKVNTPNPQMVVHADPLGANGMGYVLDAHDPAGGRRFEVLDCGGVADAVPLVNKDENRLEVAVVYPHQTEFGTDLFSARTFELRVAVCNFNLTTKAIGHRNDFAPLWDEVPFNGRPTPSNVTAGLVLPDLAPSDEPRAFWVAHEQQYLKEVNLGYKVPEGRIQLEYFKFQPGPGGQPGEWQRKARKTFKGDPGIGTWRRRPSVSSYPWDTDEITVSLAFIMVRSHPNAADGGSNIYNQDWAYRDGEMIAAPGHKLYIIPSDEHYWIDRPSALQGTNSPLIRRCYYTRDISDHPAPSPTDLVYADTTKFPAEHVIIDSDANTHFVETLRPSTDFVHFPGAVDPNYFVTTWEKRGLHQSLRIHVKFD